MSVRGSKNQLGNLSKGLKLQWEQTKESWQDDRSHEFELKYLLPLETQVTAALDAIEKLETVLSRARRDCE